MKRKQNILTTILAAGTAFTAGIFIDKKMNRGKSKGQLETYKKTEHELKGQIKSYKEKNGELEQDIIGLKYTIDGLKERLEQWHEPVGFMMGEFKTESGLVIKSIEKIEETQCYDTVFRIVVKGTHIIKTKEENGSKLRFHVENGETIIVLTKFYGHTVKSLRDDIKSCKTVDDILKLHTKVWYD